MGHEKTLMCQEPANPSAVSIGNVLTDVKLSTKAESPLEAQYTT